MELPPEQTVCVSVSFTWDMKEAERLALSWKQHYQHVWVGGPAYNSPGGDFTPGEFLKHGVVITSRGCVRKCPWCYVPLREGEIIEIPITEGWIIQDNNILACSREHIEAVCEMLKRQPHPAEFKGGLDGRLLKPWHIDLFKQIRIKDLWFACDTEKELKTLERVADLTADFPQQKKRCFVMIGYNGETLQRAEARLERVYELGLTRFHNSIKQICAKGIRVIGGISTGNGPGQRPTGNQQRR